MKDNKNYFEHIGGYIINPDSECAGLGIEYKSNKDYISVIAIKPSTEKDKSLIIKYFEEAVDAHNRNCRENGFKNIIDIDRCLIFSIYKSYKSEYKYFIPYKYWKSEQHSMFGGLYVKGDSSFSEIFELPYPIPIHNRVE